MIQRYNSPARSHWDTVEELVGRFRSVLMTSLLPLCLVQVRSGTCAD